MTSTRKTKDILVNGRHPKIVRKRVASLKASPENTQLYRYAPDDPDIEKLAASIKKYGLQEPLIVTLDNFIVSGHRRHFALIMNGQVFAPCQVLPIRRDSMPVDEYITLLREQNRQRNKTVAEQVREELIDIQPEEAYRRLRESRNKSIDTAERNGVAMLEIEGTKKRYNISDEKAEHVKYVKQVVFHDRKDYWPLSVRGVHYPLLNYEFLRNIPRKLAYKNDDNSYDATSDLLTRLRLNGTIPWEALDDFTRPRKDFLAFGDVRQFVQQEVEDLFRGYWRNLLQTQPNHIEVICEKNTIYHMVLRVTSKYQIPTSSGRGFNSIDPWHDLYEKYRASSKQRLIVILLADWDPEGEMIPQVGGRTLRDDFGVVDFDIIKAGVTREQIEEYDLPEQNFAKETSSNLDWFIARNRDWFVARNALKKVVNSKGEEKETGPVYELEALNPEDMLRDLEYIIQSVIDIDLFNREVEAEQKEAAHLEAVRRTAVEALKGLGQ